jgi:Ribonuclease G/E
LALFEIRQQAQETTCARSAHRTGTIRRGVFRDVEELIMAIGAYIDKHNDQPKPFIWTAKAADILEKVKRTRKTLDNLAF